MRSDTKTIRNGVRRRSAATTDSVAPNPELLTIPRLGRVRAEALAAAGVTSLDDLRNMALDDLARIKWIGAGNARLIKQWLETHDAGVSETSTQPEPAKRSRAPRAAAGERQPHAPTGIPAGRTRAPRSTETTDTAAPARAPRRPRAPRATAATPAETEVPSVALVPASPAPVGLEHPADASAPVTIVESVEGLPPLVPSQRVDEAVARIKDAIPKKSREKKLGRQLKKVTQSVAGIPGSLEGLPGAEKQAALDALDRIAESINAAVVSGRLSAKKQDALGVELKKLRKQLEKALSY